KGEALVSVLDKDGSPTPVERILIRPPESQIGPASQEQQSEIISRSPYKGRYEAAIDRESAYELLKQKAKTASFEDLEKIEASVAKKQPKTSGRTRETATEALMKSAARSIGSQIGRQIVRGVLGSLLGGRR
ncbi:MAG: helicase HerA-like domain-containing protein, partial [Gammaproteobacteria bacterium]